MSKLDDGMNDLVILTDDKSRLQLAKLLIYEDNGEYFNKDGSFSNSLGCEYFKVSEWEIKPKRKGPVPQNLNYQLPQGTETFDNEIYSIDGEKYPAQDIKAKVIHKALRIYC